MLQRIDLKRVVLLLALASSACGDVGLSAQTRPTVSRLAITLDRLAVALTDTKGLSYDLSVVAARANRQSFRLPLLATPEGGPDYSSPGALETLLKDAPFEVRVLTPYTRAAFTAADARRRYAPVPALTADSLNADGLIVSVTAGTNFLTADTIQTVVLAVDGRIVQPTRKALETREIANRVGARRSITVGAFYFTFEDFERLPLAIFCVGETQTLRLWIEDEDLVR